MEEVKSGLLTPVNVVALASLLCATLWLSWWFYDRSQYLDVTDARIASTMISISSRMPNHNRLVYKLVLLFNFFE